ncbi:MAG TPA: ACP S-malonyltransferase [Steroidobacteraceae bacterium]|jgi:[acyl-carrier-protein] S-malonyltransferase|nr:ACP S-malonyltransferase [Steroidobacteraceae bacterium]
MNFAFVFPGQNSQSVGMLAELAATDPIVQATFEDASAVLGYDLWELIQQGPEERLNATEFTQPAMLTAGVATWRLWHRRGGPAPGWVAGHSLGEFTALVCAEALELAPALELVAFRGKAMQEAVPRGTGAMAAILGLEDAQVEAACQQAAQGGIVEPVNFNSPGQVVIAGQAEAVQRAMEAAKTRGAKRAVLLAVSVPSHSSLMRPAARRLEERLASVSVKAPRIGYLSAVDATRHEDPEDIRQLLVRQLASPVRWTDTVRALAAAGAAQIIECGPGKVLTGLNRRIEKRPGLDFLALEDSATLTAALAAVQGAANA